MVTPEMSGPVGPGVGRPLSAAELAQEAAEAVRALSHVTIFPDGDGGLRYPADVYATLGELATLGHRLPQAVRQLTAFLHRQHQAGHVAIDAGTRYAGDPAAAVEGATVFLQVAEQLAEQLGAALDQAAQALAFASYSGPEPGAEAGAEVRSEAAPESGR